MRAESSLRAGPHLHSFPTTCQAQSSAPYIRPGSVSARCQISIPCHGFFTTRGYTDYNFQFHRPDSKKSHDQPEVTTSKRQNWDLKPDPCTAILNTGPSYYPILYLDIRLLTQTHLSTENLLVCSRLHNPIGSLESHLTSHSLRFLLIYSGRSVASQQLINSA